MFVMFVYFATLVIVFIDTGLRYSVNVDKKIEGIINNKRLGKKPNYDCGFFVILRVRGDMWNRILLRLSHKPRRDIAIDIEAVLKIVAFTPPMTLVQVAITVE